MIEFVSTTTRQKRNEEKQQQLLLHTFSLLHVTSSNSFSSDKQTADFRAICRVSLASRWMTQQHDTTPLWKNMCRCSFACCHVIYSFSFCGRGGFSAAIRNVQNSSTTVSSQNPRLPQQRNFTCRFHAGFVRVDSQREYCHQQTLLSFSTLFHFQHSNEYNTNNQHHDE